LPLLHTAAPLLMHCSACSVDLKGISPVFFQISV
jgi:hypothetical protein